MSYQDDFVKAVKEIITHGKENQAEKITVTWQQYVGKLGPLNHAVTITYRDHELLQGVDKR